MPVSSCLVDRSSWHNRSQVSSFLFTFSLSFFTVVFSFYKHFFNSISLIGFLCFSTITWKDVAYGKLPIYFGLSRTHSEVAFCESMNFGRRDLFFRGFIILPCVPVLYNFESNFCYNAVWVWISRRLQLQYLIVRYSRTHDGRDSSIGLTMTTSSKGRKRKMVETDWCWTGCYLSKERDARFDRGTAIAELDRKEEGK